MFINCNGKWVNSDRIRRIEWQNGDRAGNWVAVDADNKRHPLYHHTAGSLERLLGAIILAAPPGLQLLDVYVGGGDQGATHSELLPLVGWVTDGDFAIPIGAGDNQRCRNEYRFIVSADRYIEITDDGCAANLGSREAAVAHAEECYAVARASADAGKG